MKKIILLIVLFSGISCAKLRRTDCPDNENCNICKLCLENQLDKEIYWDREIQGAHDDTIAAGATKCFEVDVHIDVKYDRFCDRSKYNYSGTNMLVGSKSLYMRLDRCEKKFTIQYDIAKEVKIVDETPTPL